MPVTPRRRRIALLALFVLPPTAVLAGCGATSSADAPAMTDAVDGENEPFLTSADGKADAKGLTDGTPSACAALKLANTASLEALDDDVGLDVRAAAGIVAARAGADGRPGTEDDAPFDRLSELDAVPYVGRRVFERLVSFAGAKSVQCGTVSVQLLATNDFHGNLEPPSGSSGRIVTGANPEVDRVDAGGAEFLATHLERLAAENPNTVRVAAGDIIGATPLLSALFHDEPTVESMNLMGLDVAAVGNHEFDEGAAELQRMQSGGCHPVDGCQDGDGFEGAAWLYLAANVLDDETGEPVLPAYVIKRFGQARVAFIGMTLEGTPLVTTPQGTVGLSFLDEVETVAALMPELEAQGIRSIVVLLHEGGLTTGSYQGCEGISGPLFEIARTLPAAVDVVVAGHTNAAHVCDLDGKLVTSAASFGRLITDIDLSLDEVTGHVVAKTARNVLVTRDVEKDTDQTALINRYRTLAAPLANRVVGRVAADLTKTVNTAGESPLGLVIADAQLEATRSSGAAVLALMNPGGVRTDLVYAQQSGGEAAGEVTFSELFAVQPFSNNLVTLSLTGAHLVQVLEAQWRVVGGAEKSNILQVSEGFAYTWDASKPIGQRIDRRSLTLDGRAVVDSQTYRVTVNSFLADGGDGFAAFREGTERSAGALDVEALEAFLTGRSPVAPPATSRVVRVN